MEAEKLSDSGLTLLIVDDEPLMTELFRQAMTRRGFQVLTATGGAEALRIVSAETIHLVLTDMTMPGMDGIALAYALFTQAPDLPVLIATGHEADAMQLGLPPNVVGIIKKPYQHKVLAERIHKILGSEP
ncbi:MAG TPA: response regulator [Chthonomonadaceae bacterium]|nr:response regulator [Chthonomonadaceae bacterium]